MKYRSRTARKKNARASRSDAPRRRHATAAPLCSAPAPGSRSAPAVHAAAAAAVRARYDIRYATRFAPRSTRRPPRSAFYHVLRATASSEQWDAIPRVDTPDSDRTRAPDSPASSTASTHGSTRLAIFIYKLCHSFTERRASPRRTPSHTRATTTDARGGTWFGY